MFSTLLGMQVSAPRTSSESSMWFWKILDSQTRIDYTTTLTYTPFPTVPSQFLIPGKAWWRPSGFRTRPWLQRWPLQTAAQCCSEWPCPPKAAAVDSRSRLWNTGNYVEIDHLSSAAYIWHYLHSVCMYIILPSEYWVENEIQKIRE